MDRVTAAEDRPAFLDNNQRFHDLILRTADNRMMRELAQQLIMPIYQFRLPHRLTIDDMHASYAAHRRITTAIMTGDGAVAEQEMREHILQSGRKLIAALDAIEAAREAERPKMRQRSIENA
jgi:DNA-binding GntR family transcriptional regulator